MKVRDWVEFLQKDEITKVIGLEMEGGLYCRTENYVEKEKFCALVPTGLYLDEEVIKVYHNNFPGGTLLVYKKS